jgi:hypothetical protein
MRFSTQYSERTSNEKLERLLRRDHATSLALLASRECEVMAKVTTLYNKVDPVAVAVASTRNIDKAAEQLKDIATILIRDGRYEELAELHKLINDLAASYSVEPE